jgi:steroid delta-isomerase-like uncharacterized protein
VSLEENKAVVRRWIEGGYGRGNLDLIEEMIAPDFVNRTPLPGQPPTREGVAGGVRGLRAAFPDLAVTIEEIVAEGDLVVTRDVSRGTHRGPFAGIPPTGRQVTVSRIAIFRVKDGRITEHWANVDMLGLMQQLGAIPAPGQRK